MGILKNILIFAAGAAVGAASVYKYVKTKYEKIADAEIASAKEAFMQKEASETTEEAATETAPEAEEGNAYRKMAAKAVELRGKASGRDDIHVIPPNDYGLEEDYERVTLYYYADGQLADDRFFLIEDIDGCVGADFAEHFGDYEDDCVHIQNDREKCYFEILRSLKTYEEDKCDAKNRNQI